jgi:CubicO group peptidase (beta-lactamase class C family)
LRNSISADKLRELESFLSRQAPNKPYSRDEDLSRRIGCVVKDGYMVYAWGDQAAKFNWYSAAKPVLTTLLFFGIQDGRIDSVDAPISPYIPGLRGKDRGITFRHLADMTSGYACTEAPGAAWSYNDYAIQLYCLAMEKALGRSIKDAAHHYLAPLKLEDGDIIGVNHRGRGVVTTARDLARVGWFWMNRGGWAGRRVLAQAYLDAYRRPDVPGKLPRSTSKQPDDYLEIGSYGGKHNQSGYGPGIYGFNWWFNAEMGTSGKLALSAGPRDMFMAMGFAGNYMVMLPGQGILVAARGSWDDIEPDNPAGSYNIAIRLLMEAIQPLADPSTQPKDGAATATSQP